MLKLNSKNKDAFAARLNALTDNSERRFGQLTAAGMIVHLRKTIELSLGEIEASDQSNFFSRTVGYVLIYHVLPWPKGKVKVPEAFTPAPTENLPGERVHLFKTIDRFVLTAESEAARTGLHPMFGHLTLRRWQHVHGRHFEHHLRQFGV